MKYLAKYQHRRHEAPEYYRTIHSEGLNEAIKQAERWTKKGFIMVGVTSHE